MLLSWVQLWQADTVEARGMTYQQWGKLQLVLAFLYEHQQNLLDYLLTFSSVYRWAWSTRFPSQCNAYSHTWLTSAATHDSVTSTSHDAWNTSFILAHFILWLVSASVERRVVGSSSSLTVHFSHLSYHFPCITRRKFFGGFASS